MEAILFLIGIQEVGDFQTQISKEQKQDLMHVAGLQSARPADIMNLTVWMKKGGHITDRSRPYLFSI